MVSSSCVELLIGPPRRIHGLDRLLLTSSCGSMFPPHTLCRSLSLLYLLLFSPSPRTPVICLSVVMDPTEEEADFPNSSMGLAPARPPLFPLRHNKPSAQKRSNPLIDLETNSYKVPSSLTGPPSPSASGIVGSIFDTNSILASSSWPQRVEESYSFPLSTFLSSTSPRNSEAVVEEEKRTPLPPISQSCRSNSSLIPRLSGPSLPPSSSPPSSPTPPSEQTDVGSRSFLLKPPTVDWDEFASRSSDPLNRKDKVALWAAIQVAGVPIYLSNPGFDGQSRSLYSTYGNMPTSICAAFSLCPSASGTYCSPTALLATFSDVEVFYHAYAAGKKLSREDLWVFLHILEKSSD